MERFLLLRLTELMSELSELEPVRTARWKRSPRNGQKDSLAIVRFGRQ